jgi:hypothetical protein
MLIRNEIFNNSTDRKACCGEFGEKNKKKLGAEGGSIPCEMQQGCF